MAKLIKYYEDEVLRPNDKVTVVKGHLEGTTEELNQLTDKIVDALSDIREVEWNYTTAVSVGRSKCSKKDTPDPKIGLAIASRRAELKALDKACRLIEKANKVFTDSIVKFNTQYDEFKFRTNKIKEDLKSLEE